MKEKYLPIGSVVTLKDATKKIMIIGYCPVEKGKNIMYDYSACLYPEGVIDSNKMLLFNHNQIATIHFVGFESEEQKQNNEKLKTLVTNMNNFKDIKVPNSDKPNSNTNVETLNVD